MYGVCMPAHNYRSVLLAVLFFCIVGTFWLLGSLQEPIFYHLVGREYHPQVNVLAFVCIMPMLLWSLAAINRFQPQRVLAGAALLYMVFFGCAAVLLGVPGIGLPGATPAVSNILGWAFFAVVKTYGSLMVTLFWTYATSIVSVDDAKRIFPFVTVCAQLGSLGGATLARVGAGWGIPILVWIAVLGMSGIVVSVWALVRLEGESSEIARVPRETQGIASLAGMYQGLVLLASRPYLRGILAVSTAYLVITAFFDYQLHFLAHQQYPLLEDFTWFKGVYGQLVNAATCVLALWGTGWFLRVFGVALCLLLYPLVTAVCVTAAWLYPTLGVVAGVMVVMRALSIGFNNPTKEIVYIPESQEVRFRAKGWIDVVGYRGAFALGSQITVWIAQPQSVFVAASTVISYGVIALWVYYARMVGARFSPAESPR
jgi:AAA family ATP:ADP antiporter